MKNNKKLKSFIILSIIFFAILFSAKSSLATTINAASCGQADVQTAVTAATDGDIVLIPEGDCTFSSIVPVDLVTGGTRSLTILGSGIAKTVIRGRGFSFTGAEGKAWRLSSMTLVGGAGVTVFGQSKTWRIDHIYFDHPTGQTSGRVIWVEATGSRTAYTSGVIDNCTFYHPQTIQVHVRRLTGGGNDTWARPLGLGGPDAVYIEDCTFEVETVPSSAITDCEGANFVFRHNTVINGYLTQHDAIIGGLRGCRKWEIYDNLFEVRPGNNAWFGLAFRGGTGVIFNNVWNGRPGSEPIAVATYRYSQTGGPPWSTLCSAEVYYGCFGTTVSPKSCTPGGGQCDSDCVRIDGTGGWPCRDQLGTDGGKEQSNVPALFWNNKYCTMYSASGCTPTLNSGVNKYIGASTMVEGRDYCIANDTMPASCNGVTTTYVPYTYPHPLRAEATDTTPPAPPSGVTVI